MARPDVPRKPAQVVAAVNAVGQAAPTLTASQGRRVAALRIGRGALAIAATAASAAALWRPRPARARVIGDAGAPLAPTPALTEGPFYPPMFSATPARRLYRGATPGLGTAMQLAGRIVDTTGRPLAGARIEIWQCDARGHYHHPRDRGADDRDPDFLGFGWQPADAGGRYAFATIVPVPYPGRTPHVHVRVRQDGRTVLTSQIFLPEQLEANTADFLWRSLTPADRARVAGTDAAASPDDRAAPAQPDPAGSAQASADRLLLCDLVVS